MKDHTSILTTMHISTSLTSCPLRSCKYISALRTIGEYEQWEKTFWKTVLRITTSSSQRVSCTITDTEYTKITGSLTEWRLKGYIFLPLASRKKNNLRPVISYIAIRITVDPRVWFLKVVLQHDENTHMEAPWGEG